MAKLYLGLALLNILTAVIFYAFDWDPLLSLLWMVIAVLNTFNWGLSRTP